MGYSAPENSSIRGLAIILTIAECCIVRTDPVPAPAWLIPGFRYRSSDLRVDLSGLPDYLFTPNRFRLYRGRDSWESVFIRDGK